MKILIVALCQLLFSFVLACDNVSEIPYPIALDHEESYIDELLDRGEELLLEGDLLNASKAFTDAIDSSNRKGMQKIRLCRALFGRSIAYASMGKEKEALSDLKVLDNEVQKFKCPQALSSSDEYTAGGRPILGEDQIAIEDCIKRAQNTVGYIKDLLSLASVDTKWKIAFISTLYLMEEKAIQCCRAGGVWKACLQPLLEKWLDLKDWERECRRSGHWYLFD